MLPVLHTLTSVAGMLVEALTPQEDQILEPTNGDPILTCTENTILWDLENYQYKIVLHGFRKNFITSFSYGMGMLCFVRNLAPIIFPETGCRWLFMKGTTSMQALYTYRIKTLQSINLPPAAAYHVMIG